MTATRWRATCERVIESINKELEGENMADKVKVFKLPEELRGQKEIKEVAYNVGGNTFWVEFTDGVTLEYWHDGDVSTFRPPPKPELICRDLTDCEVRDGD